MRPTTSLCSALFATALIAPAGAAVVEVDYALTAGSAAIDPFTLPNPQGGEDLTVTPGLTIDSGSFVARFQSDELGVVGDGDAGIFDFTFAGELDIAISTEITIGIFPVTVTANLVGPVTGTQVAPSSGSLVATTAYAETGPGLYDIVAGPLGCTDNAFGAVCSLIETGLGVTFPITQVAGDDSPLPFTGGTFDNLNAGPSSAGTALDFSVPVDDTTSFGATVDFDWAETGRRLVAVPEPSASIWLLGAALTCALRRRRR